MYVLLRQVCDRKYPGWSERYIRRKSKRRTIVAFIGLGIAVRTVIDEYNFYNWRPKSAVPVEVGEQKQRPDIFDKLAEPNKKPHLVLDEPEAELKKTKRWFLGKLIQEVIDWALHISWLRGCGSWFWWRLACLFSCTAFLSVRQVACNGFLRYKSEQIANSYEDEVV